MRNILSWKIVSEKSFINFNRMISRCSVNECQMCHCRETVNITITITIEITITVTIVITISSDSFGENLLSCLSSFCYYVFYYLTYFFSHSHQLCVLLFSLHQHRHYFFNILFWFFPIFIHLLVCFNISLHFTFFLYQLLVFRFPFVISF